VLQEKHRQSVQESTWGPPSAGCSAAPPASGRGRCATSRSSRPASAASGLSSAVRASIVCAEGAKTL
jgi:hypothetical protein